MENHERPLRQEQVRHHRVQEEMNYVRVALHLNLHCNHRSTRIRTSHSHLGNHIISIVILPNIQTLCRRAKPYNP